MYSSIFHGTMADMTYQEMFEELVDEETARKLESSKTTPELFMKWQKGGIEA